MIFKYFPEKETVDKATELDDSLLDIDGILKFFPDKKRNHAHE
jgi:hypothetical protein